jgi:hypothetical protein
VNLYDPVWHAPELFFGYSFPAVLPHLSHLLFENHALGAAGVNNAHLAGVIRQAGKAAFIVSYRKGIGCDAQWPQRDLDAIASEAAALGYHPCLKASEYVRGKTWHAADLSAWKTPAVTPVAPGRPRFSPKPLPASTPLGRLKAQLVGALQKRLSRWFFETRLPMPGRRKLFAAVCRSAHPFTLADACGGAAAR